MTKRKTPIGPKPPPKSNVQRQREWKARQRAKKAAEAEALAVARAPHLTVTGWKQPTDEELLDPALVRVRLARAYERAVAGFPGIDPHALVALGRAYAALVGCEAPKKLEHTAKVAAQQAPNAPPPWLNEAPTTEPTEKH